MVTDVKEIYCGDHFAVIIIIMLCTCNSYIVIGQIPKFFWKSNEENVGRCVQQNLSVLIQCHKYIYAHMKELYHKFKVFLKK